MDCNTTGFPVLQLSPGVRSNSCPLNCCCSVTQSCLTLCDPIDCSTQGLTVPQHLPKFAQGHVHCITDAIQPSHPLMPSSPSALDVSQYQGLYQWVSCSQQMTKILEFQVAASVLPAIIQGWFPLRVTELIHLLSKGLARDHSLYYVEPCQQSLCFSTHSLGLW